MSSYTPEYQHFDKCLDELKRHVTLSRLITFTGYKVCWYHNDVIYAGIKYILTVKFDEISVEWGKEYEFECVDIQMQCVREHCFKVYDWDSYYFTFYHSEIVLVSYSDDIAFQHSFNYCINDLDCNVMTTISHILHITGVLVSPRFVVLARYAKSCIKTE
jgi:hypothetical protein